MTIRLRNAHSSRLVLFVALLTIPAVVFAAGGRKRVPKFGEFNPDHKSVEMFEAIEKGDVEVTLIPKDSTECRVMIKNKTKQPLNVKLPEAFAGVPVLAQNVNNNRNNRNNNNSNQSFGGGMMGMGGMGMGMGGMGMGGMGMFNVPPEKVGNFKVPTVCLEHGKADPAPRKKYTIKPIATFTDKKEVHELCRMLGTKRIGQRAAQAAAWNLSNDMTWQELAAKRIEHANGTSEPYFAAAEIQVGMRLSQMASVLAEKKRQASEKSESTTTQ